MPKKVKELPNPYDYPIHRTSSMPNERHIKNCDKIVPAYFNMLLITRVNPLAQYLDATNNGKNINEMIKKFNLDKKSNTIN